ncbi:MAG TPA: carboxypeptidase-like regulatory domain-containing protein [Kofleriaceae bacterium]|nr:carboxypeptidase-like regulatory domain-containing protein [Kofleriaceae bacterium]
MSVTVYDDRGLPAVGVQVLLSDDGGLVAELVTDDDGQASAPATGPVDVTVVREGLQTRLTTMRDAEPGDALRFGVRRGDVPSVAQQVTWTTDVSAVQYYLYSSCRMQELTLANPVIVDAAATATQTTTLMFDPACIDDHDILLVYYGQLGVIPSYRLISHIAGGGQVMFDEPWTPFGAATTATFTQLPAGVTPGGAGSSSLMVQSVFPHAGSVTHGLSATNYGLTATADGASAYDLFPLFDQRDATLSIAHDADARRWQKISQRLPAAATLDLAVAPASLPWLTTLPAADFDAHAIIWKQADADAGQDTADLLVIHFVWAGASRSWRIIAPPGRAVANGAGDERRFALPAIPTLTDLLPGPGDTAAQVWLRLYGFGGTTGYRDVRPFADLAISDINEPWDSYQNYPLYDTWLLEPEVTRVTSSQYLP